MKTEIKRVLVSINKVMTIINGFIFGILIQFSPLHNKKGNARRIPLGVNVALLVVLVVVLVAIIR